MNIWEDEPAWQTLLSSTRLPNHALSLLENVPGTSESSRKASLRAMEKPHSQENCCPSPSAVGGLRGLHPTHFLSQLV